MSLDLDNLRLRQSYDSAKVKIIRDNNKLYLPEPDIISNWIDEVRVTSFSRGNVRPRQVPDVDMMEAERLRNFGQRVDVTSSWLYDKLKDQTMKLPVLFPDPNNPGKWISRVGGDGNTIQRHHTWTEIMGNPVHSYNALRRIIPMLSGVQDVNRNLQALQAGLAGLAGGPGGPGGPGIGAIGPVGPGPIQMYGRPAPEEEAAGGIVGIESGQSYKGREEQAPHASSELLNSSQVLVGVCMEDVRRYMTRGGPASFEYADREYIQTINAVPDPGYRSFSKTATRGQVFITEGDLRGDDPEEDHPFEDDPEEKSSVKLPSVGSLETDSSYPMRYIMSRARFERNEDIPEFFKLFQEMASESRDGRVDLFEAVMSWNDRQQRDLPFRREREVEREFGSSEQMQMPMESSPAHPLSDDPFSGAFQRSSIPASDEPPAPPTQPLSDDPAQRRQPVQRKQPRPKSPSLFEKGMQGFRNIKTIFDPKKEAEMVEDVGEEEYIVDAEEALKQAKIKYQKKGDNIYISSKQLLAAVAQHGQRDFLRIYRQMTDAQNHGRQSFASKQFLITTSEVLSGETAGDDTPLGAANLLQFFKRDSINEAHITIKNDDLHDSWLVLHGYFFIGPFAKLGPLRDSDIGLLAGFMSTIGLIVILTIGLTIYGVATFGQEKSTGNPNDLQTKKAWDEFKGGFFVGACGSAGFAFICLSSIPTFSV